MFSRHLPLPTCSARTGILLRVVQGPLLTLQNTWIPSSQPLDACESSPPFSRAATMPGSLWTYVAAAPPYDYHGRALSELVQHWNPFRQPRCESNIEGRCIGIRNHVYSLFKSAIWFPYAALLTQRFKLRRYMHDQVGSIIRSLKVNACLFKQSNSALRYLRLRLLASAIAVQETPAPEVINNLRYLGCRYYRSPRGERRDYISFPLACWKHTRSSLGIVKRVLCSLGTAALVPESSL